MFTITIKIYMTMMNFATISAFVLSNITRNSFGVVLVTETEPYMNKRGNSYLGRVTKRTTSTHVALGRDYQRKVNNDLTKKGLTADFKAAKPSGKHIWDTDTLFFEQSDTDAEKFYLRVMYNKNSKTTTEWLVDGRAATQAEIEEFSKFIPKSSPSAKQMAHGLDAEETEVFRSYLTTSIVSIKQGAKVLK